MSGESLSLPSALGGGRNSEQRRRRTVHCRVVCGASGGRATFMRNDGEELHEELLLVLLRAISYHGSA